MVVTDKPTSNLKAKFDTHDSVKGIYFNVNLNHKPGKAKLYNHLKHSTYQI